MEGKGQKFLRGKEKGKTRKDLRKRKKHNPQY